MSANSFDARSTLQVGDESYEIFRLDKVEGSARLPYSLKVLLENLLRTEDGANITADHIRSIGDWDSQAQPSQEIQFTPARVIMQDFTGVPCVVDLATMREAVKELGGDPAKVNPLSPAELVIDHSVIADKFGTKEAFGQNVELEYGRNKERYQFLRWGQTAFDDFKVVPPGTGIVHQVNIEHLARTVMVRNGQAYPDTLVGTDSHTTMVNGLGVLGWGVGGIEAEAAMLGQPVSMLIPRVVGFKLTGELTPGTTATDLVLTITEMLRKHGVVGKFVEFYGEGVAATSLANRATIGNMSPEFGSTAAIFPIDGETIKYLKLTGRSEQQLALVEAYAKEQGLWLDPAAEPDFSEKLELDLSTVVPSIMRPEAPAGPHRPRERRRAVQERRAQLRRRRRRGGQGVLPGLRLPGRRQRRPVQPGHGHGPRRLDLRDRPRRGDGRGHHLLHQHLEPVRHGRRRARREEGRGEGSDPQAVGQDHPRPRLQGRHRLLRQGGAHPYLDKVGFNLVGYGCTTCIGNSGPLPDEVSKAVNDHDLAVTSVLSGNRNFEGRINPDVKMNYLASPPLVVAYALAGSMKVDITRDALGTDTEGKPVYLADIWPSEAEVNDVVANAIGEDMFNKSYQDVFAGDAQWQALPIPEGNTFEWDPQSTYVRKPPYFEGMTMETTPVSDIAGARVLAKLGDSVTTDHISPAGAIKADTPGGKYLTEHGVERRDFNSYGSRRGNHEVMIRGTFANIRLRNQIAPGTEGGYTRDFTKDGAPVSFIYDASRNYIDQGIPLVILAGKEYGSGSSRDWAAKGTALLGVKAVIAESYERIHRSNLIGMGVLPLQFPEGATAESLGLTGEETFSFTGVEELNNGTTPRTVKVATDTGVEFDAVVRIDTPGEADYYRNGGIMQYVLRNLIRN